MATEDGRKTVEYLVRCALPAGRSVSKYDENSILHTYPGLLGVAPEWETSVCDTACQERLSACMLAHLNTTGISVPIYLVGSDEEFPSIGPALDDEFPKQESAFYGNIFISPPVAGYCEGEDLAGNVIAGRAGSSGTKQYTNLLSTAGCSGSCTTLAEGSGYASCGGYSRVLTVYIQ
jgi:hypothetical protein